MRTVRMGDRPTIIAETADKAATPIGVSLSSNRVSHGRDGCADEAGDPTGRDHQSEHQPGQTYWRSTTTVSAVNPPAAARNHTWVETANGAKLGCR